MNGGATKAPALSYAKINKSKYVTCVEKLLFVQRLVIE